MRSTQALYVRCRTRRYEPANPEQVLEAAKLIVDARMQRGTSFGDPNVACAFFRDKLGSREREVFVAAMLDTRHRLIEYVELFFGTVDGTEVHPREVVKQALRQNAAAVIVAHNHPSGEIEASAADRAVTARLKHALALVDVRLLDWTMSLLAGPKASAWRRGAGSRRSRPKQARYPNYRQQTVAGRRGDWRGVGGSVRVSTLVLIRAGRLPFFLASWLKPRHSCH